MPKVTPPAGGKDRFEHKPDSRTESSPPSRDSGTEVPSSPSYRQQPALGHGPAGAATPPVLPPVRGRGLDVPSWLGAPGTYRATRADTFAALKALAPYLLPRAPRPGFPELPGSSLGQELVPESLSGQGTSLTAPALGINGNNSHRCLLRDPCFTSTSPNTPDEQIPRNYCPHYTDQGTAAAPESWITSLGSQS